MTIASVAQARVLVEVPLNFQYLASPLVRLDLRQVHWRVERAEFAKAIAANVRAQSARVN